MARLRRLAMARGAVPIRVWEASSPLSRYRDNGETRRRGKVIGRLPGEQSCLSLVWAVLDRASKGWRGLTMTPKALRRLQDLRRELLHQRSDH
jgi:transposase-like protein